MNFCVDFSNEKLSKVHKYAHIHVVTDRQIDRHTHMHEQTFEYTLKY